MLQGCAIQSARLCFTFDSLKLTFERWLDALVALADLEYHGRQCGNADLSEHARYSIKLSGPEQSHI